MTDKINYLEKVAVLSEALERKGFRPVLVGGIALVILGSQRVTKDFDFLVMRNICRPDENHLQKTGLAPIFLSGKEIL